MGTVRDDQMTKQTFPQDYIEDEVFQTYTARRRLLVCVQRKHCIAYRAANSHSASVRVTGLSQN